MGIEKHDDHIQPSRPSVDKVKKVRVDALPGSSDTLLALKLPVAAKPADPEVSELDEPLCEL